MIWPVENSIKRPTGAFICKWFVFSVLFSFSAETLFWLNVKPKAEKIKVTDKQAEKEAKELAEKYGMTSEDFLKELGGLEVLKYDMTMRKAIDCMKESN